MCGECATVLTAEKVQCLPSSPCSRNEMRCAWLRAAPPPPISSVVLRVAWALPGRDGKNRLADRTKLDLGGRRLDVSIALRIERDDADRRPVTRVPTPASRVAFPRT